MTSPEYDSVVSQVGTQPCMKQGVRFNLVLGCGVMQCATLQQE